MGCCWYHKGTNFQANHNIVVQYWSNPLLLLIPQRYKFSSKSQPMKKSKDVNAGCCWYHKGTNFQANHNWSFKRCLFVWLLLIPQRYKFSSKSQLDFKHKRMIPCCCWYHKGTNFQANHNKEGKSLIRLRVVADTTKVQIFKQITTNSKNDKELKELLLIPQRYKFSSKSQRPNDTAKMVDCCCWYHKGTNFQANHNWT